MNDSLLRSDWEDAIVWDERELTSKAVLLRHQHALLLDQNDPHVIVPPLRALLHLSSIAYTPPADQYVRYNVSMDASYHVADTSLSSYHVLKIVHALFASNLDPSIYRTRMTSTELQQYHRPLLSFPHSDALSLVLRPVDVTVGLQVEDRDTRFVPTVLEELTAMDSDIILCEYLERYPPLLMNAGMCSQLITYYRKKDDLDVHQPEVTDGDVVVLARRDSSPFLGEVKPGTTVTALTNNLFISPLAKHAAPAHTFLLIRSEASWFIRPLPSCYIVGQQEPKQSVPYPHRAHALELLRKQIEVFILKRLASGRKRFHMEELEEQFGPSLVNETLAKKVLKDIASFSRTTNEWVLDSLDKLPSEEKLQLLCTPEDVCCYEAMLAADHRLKDELGIKQFTNAKQITDIIDHLTQPDVSRVSIYIEKHLHLMPWTLTKGFLSAKDGKGSLRLSGRGNPFADGAGYSYINEKVTAKKAADEWPEIAEPKKKTGTNADLRKLTMEEMAAALVKLGKGEEEVAGMPRWDRVRAIAKLSMEAVVEGKYPNLKRFARQVRPTSAKMMEDYRRDVQLIFDRQLQMLAYTGRPDYSHEVNDDVGAVKEKGGAAAMRQKAKDRGKSEYLTQKRKEREEEEAYNDFLAQRERGLKEAQTHSTAKAKPTTTAASPRATAAAATSPGPSSSSASSAVPVKRKKKVLITKLQHVIRVTNKDGTQTVETRVYDDVELLRAFLLDCKDHSRDKGKHLRQRLQLDSMHVGEKKDRPSGARDDDDEDDEKAPRGEAKVEVVPPPPGRVKIRTLDAIRARMRGGRGGVGGGGGGGGGLMKKKRTKKGEIDDMFELNDDDWKSGGHGAFSLPSPSAADTSSPIITSTSSGTLKLSRRQLQQTPQDVYVKTKKRKLDSDPFVAQPKKKLVSRRRGDARVYLSSALEEVLQEVIPMVYSAPFREPVSAEEAPDYEEEIAHPMDLSTIRSHCRNNHYNSREEFLKDIHLILSNCEQFNGVGAELSRLARLLVDDVHALMEGAYRERLDAAEAAIVHHTLLSRLDQCIGVLQGLPDSKVFQVTPAWADYLAKVAVPISLDVLKDRVSRREYETAGEFMRDVRQMVDNSVTYNGPVSHYTQRVQQMFARARDYLEKWYTQEQLQPSDALLQRKKREEEATASHAAQKAAAPPRSSPVFKYQPSSRTPALAGARMTPGAEGTTSPARSPEMSPTAPTASPDSAPQQGSPMPPLSPGFAQTPSAAVSVSMTPFLTAPLSSAASPLPPSSSSPSPRAAPAAPAVETPLVSSTSAFLPAAPPAGHAPSALDDHDDVLDVFGGDPFGVDMAMGGGGGLMAMDDGVVNIGLDGMHDDTEKKELGEDDVYY